MIAFHQVNVIFFLSIGVTTKPANKLTEHVWANKSIAHTTTDDNQRTTTITKVSNQRRNQPNIIMTWNQVDLFNHDA